jgi:hypothetical protein
VQVVGYNAVVTSVRNTFIAKTRMRAKLIIVSRNFGDPVGEINIPLSSEELCHFLFRIIIFSILLN